jgi:uncharacterized protein (DUF885 family)
MKKFWSLLLAACLMAGCAGSAAPEKETESDTQTEKVTDSQKETETVKETEEKSTYDEDFEAYLKQYLIDMCEQDYTTAHHYFEDPEAYGIDLSKTTVSLGSFIPSEEETGFNQEILDELNEWDASQLSKTNQQILAQLKWEYALAAAKENKNYYYLDPIWSEMSGVQSELTDYFSVYRLYKEEDIPYLLELINDVPNYVSEALEYSKKQAEMKMLRVDLEAVKEACEDTLATKDDSPITNALLDEVDGLNLDEAKAQEYKQQISDAMQNSFFPSYQQIIDGLEALKHEIVTTEGLGAYAYGSDYYELVLQYYTGTDLDSDTIMNDLYAEINSYSNRYNKLMQDNPELADEIEDIDTGFKSIDEIMAFLEKNYTKEFPKVETMQYTVKPLADEQSNEGVLAYFITPTIDSTRPYEIFYNKRDYGDDAADLQLYNTLAHEGIPGHMYQAQYNKEHFTNDVQYTLTNFGFQEGYATYAGFQASEWTDVDPDLITLSTLTEFYSYYMILLMDIQINGQGMSLEEFEKTWSKGLDDLYYQLAENPGIFFGYYFGYYVIDKFETQAKEALGDKFDAVEFNDVLLSAGSVNFNIIQENINSYIEENGGKVKPFLTTDEEEQE